MNSYRTQNAQAFQDTCFFPHDFDHDICNINSDPQKMTSGKKSATLGNNLLVVNWYDHVKNKIIIKRNHVKMTGTRERTPLFDQVRQTTMKHVQQAAALRGTEGSIGKADQGKRASCHPEEFDLLRQSTTHGYSCSAAPAFSGLLNRKIPITGDKLLPQPVTCGYTNTKYIFLSDIK